ncbi:MAG: D-aminoacylase [Bacteroidales bacterium]
MKTFPLKSIEGNKQLTRRDFLKTSAIAAGAFGAAAIGGSAIAGFFTGCTSKEHFDTIISNGVIYCGDGKNPIKGAIGIINGKIKAIGNLGSINNLAENCKKVIDAKGLAVSPGFIDIHSHTDTNLFEAPLGDSRIFQGITSDIGGNCGDSPFPYSDEYYATKVDSKRFGAPFWQDIDGFYEALRKQKIGINYKSYTGQGQLRSAVVGNNNVPYTQGQLNKMCNILEKEMEMGSVGLSCGLEYAPGSYATNKEIEELCKVVAKHNGLFAIHMRNEDDKVEESVAEAISIARNTGVRLQISHLKAQNAANWHKAPALIKQIEDAKALGVDIAFDRYPYIAFSTGLTSFIPLNDRQGSNEEVLARLRNNIKAAEIGEYAISRINRLGGPQNVLIAACSAPQNSIYSGKNIEECSKLSGLKTWPIIRELLISENLGVQIVGFAMKEENVQLFLTHPLGMPASDGSVYSPKGPLGNEMPHPRSYGTFPRFFGKYVREDKICDLQTAVYKCTALPASRINLKERGLLKQGYAADIVIFNPTTIIDVATFNNPHQFPNGIEHVLVNGNHTIERGKFIGELSGVVL